MLVIIGASATGKSEIVKQLEKIYPMKKFITCTTRDLRKGEVDGVDYYFFNDEEFSKLIAEDKLIEYQEYNNHMYGSLKSEIADNKVVILEPKGFFEFKNKNINCFSVYLDLSSFKRFFRMLKRKDGIKKSLQRIRVDKKVFNKDLRKSVDFVLNQKGTPEELAKVIYERYMESLVCKK